MNKKFLFMLFLVYFTSLTVFAQQRSIYGIVTDTNGQPLPGVSVVVKGTTLGTVTNSVGNYTITVPENATLVFSFVGMQSQEVPVGNQTNINPVLSDDFIGLEEVAVIGYSTKKRSELSSSISVVSDEEIRRSVSTTSISNLLQGRIPGMQISGTSGAPGSSANMVIQGMGSLQAGASPLTVVDGIIGGSYDPKDIASITILRDAAATGLYGSRAASGVIVITTKSGRSGEFIVSVNSTTGPTYNWDDRIEVYDAEGLYGQWTTAMKNLYDIRVAENHPEFVNRTFEEYRNNVIPPSILDRTTEWFDLLQRPGFINQHQIALSGGSERTTFYISGNYNHEKGTALDKFNQMGSFRANVDHKVSDKIKAAVRMTGRYGTRTPEFYGDSRWQAWDNVPMDPAYLPDGTPTPVMNYAQVPLWFHWRRDNWMLEREESENLIKSWGGNIMGEVSWQIFDWARFNTSNRVSFSGQDHSQYWSAKTSAGYTPKGYVQWEYDYGVGYITSNTLHLASMLGDHSLSAILGQEYSYDQDRFLMGRGHGMVGTMRALSSAGSPNSIGGNMTETAFLSYFGQVDYDFRGKYFLVGSLRYDASSRFGENNRWGSFYSIGGNWLISQEGFLQGTSWLDVLKIRASHGTTGNANISDYLSMGTYSFTDLSRYNALPGAWPARLPNPDLTWEVATKTNLGFDISVFQRATLEFNVYHRINDNLLQSVPLEATTGFRNITRNIGSIRNQGIDLNLTTINIQSSEFMWESNFNINFNKNKVMELFEGKDIVVNDNQIIREGLPLRYFYMQEWRGVDPQTGLPQWTRWEDADGNRLDGVDNEEPANVIITNIHSQASLIPMSSAYPDFTGGFSNHFQYKNLFMDVLTNFAVGQQIYNSVNWSVHDFGAIRLKPTKWQDVTWWEKPGDQATLPQLIYGDPNNSRSQSSLYLEDASYLRIQKLALGYSFPYEVLGGMNNLSITGSVENLAVITGFSFGDSDTSFESPSTGASRYRPTRKFLLNIRFNL